MTGMRPRQCARPPRMRVRMSVIIKTLAVAPQKPLDRCRSWLSALL